MFEQESKSSVKMSTDRVDLRYTDDRSTSRSRNKCSARISKSISNSNDNSKSNSK